MCDLNLSKSHFCINCVTKRPVIKNKACDNWVSKLNMAYVDTCMSVTHHS